MTAGYVHSGDAVDLSVIVPARDAAETLPEQLEALRAQEWAGSWEVLVVDNGSTDSTASIVEELAADWPRLRLIRADEGIGPSYARNVGVRRAAGDGIAFCDADDVVATGWVAAMGDSLRQHRFVAGAREIGRLNPKWLSASYSPKYMSQRTVFEELFPFASSCNMGIRRDCFERFGDFDEDFLVGEDIEFSMRLWLGGIDMHFAPHAKIHYRFRPTLPALLKQASAYGRFRPRIAERLRAMGLPAPAPLAGARNWLWLLRRLPLLRTKTGRAQWLWVAGVRIGNLQGGVSVRRLYL